VERKGVEPSTSALRTNCGVVLSTDRAPLTANADSRCTTGCTSFPVTGHGANLEAFVDAIRESLSADDLKRLIELLAGRG
jgi:hypothetical protein